MKNTPLLFSGRCLYLCNTRVKFTASQGGHSCTKQSLGGWDLSRSGSIFPKGVGFPCVLLTRASLVISSDHSIMWAGLAVGILPASLMGSPHSYLRLDLVFNSAEKPVFKEKQVSISVMKFLFQMVL